MYLINKYMNSYVIRSQWIDTSQSLKVINRFFTFVILYLFVSSKNKCIRYISHIRCSSFLYHPNGIINHHHPKFLSFRKIESPFVYVRKQEKVYATHWEKNCFHFKRNITYFEILTSLYMQYNEIHLITSQEHSLFQQL